MSQTLIIAEAGVNHNGSMDLARRLVDEAAQAGADVVKFQSFRADKLVSRHARKADYQVANTGEGGPQWEMLRKLELSDEAHFELARHCRDRGIEFLSTPFDVDGVGFLTGEVGVSRLKLPSGELTNGPFLLACARTRLPLILSTGMATLGEVERALEVIAFGRRYSEGVPTGGALHEAFRGAHSSGLLEGVTLLHCTTEYPAPLAEVNLRAMDTLASAFGLPVGYSDHTEGIVVSIAAVARGATLVEKHFTLDRGMEGPDHRASLEPGELKALVSGIRAVELALGTPVKVPSPSEVRNIEIARKSLVALRPIRRGEAFTEANLGVKRPAGGASPMQFWDYLGRVAERDFDGDDLIS